jgi:hypothetical protein
MIGTSYIQISKKDLGVVIDHLMSFSHQITNISASAFSYLRVIGRLRRSLSYADCLILSHSLVISRILYCSTIYNGISKKQLLRLQRILNATLQLVDKLPRGESILSSFQSHNWLSIEKLITFRSSMLTIKVLKSGKPIYLRELLHINQHTRQLRFSCDTLLDIPHCSTRLGEKVFLAMLQSCGMRFLVLYEMLAL